MPGTRKDRYQLSLSATGRSSDAPPGTMFIWNFVRQVSLVDGPPVDSHTLETHPGPSAGFVLSRPGGYYSLDWVGFAVSQPIH